MVEESLIITRARPARPLVFFMSWWYVLIGSIPSAPLHGCGGNIHSCMTARFGRVCGLRCEISIWMQPSSSCICNHPAWYQGFIAADETLISWALFCPRSFRTLRLETGRGLPDLCSGLSSGWTYAGPNCTQNGPLNGYLNVSMMIVLSTTI